MSKRKVLIALATAFLLFGVLSGRALWQGYSALEAGDTAMGEGNAEDAVRNWRRAARWYLPLAPHVEAAYDRLRKRGQVAETEGDTQTAIAAWTGIRSSVRATRSFYTPFPERLEEADKHISVLMAQWEVQLGQSPEASPERVQWHLKLLKIDHMPSTGWSIIALLGLALWIGGGFAFALRAVDNNDRLVPKAAAYSGASIAIGLLIWLTGLYLA
ncbi:MAG: hypothetical protein JKY56_17715 [Kofleriaceae bacterium]|nr:hypothetical protein [Kofleriaceae bacterium]